MTTTRRWEKRANGTEWILVEPLDDGGIACLATIRRDGYFWSVSVKGTPQPSATSWEAARELAEAALREEGPPWGP